jgi:DNA-directed RNA polymerase subunit K
MAEEKYTKYEKARMIGARALQISMGAPFMVKLSASDIEALKYNPIEIAKKEFDEGVLPIAVKRPMPKKAGKQKADSKEEEVE